MFKMSPEVEDLILSEVSEHGLEEIAKNQGVVSLQQDAVIKLLLGYIPMNEALALIKDQITRSEFEEASTMLSGEDKGGAKPPVEHVDAEGVPKL
jgi:hypothetical protein